MAYKLHIPPCILSPPHPLHPPPPERPLRIHIQGPLISVQKLFPGLESRYDFDGWDEAPRPEGRQLATFTYEAIYGQAPSESDIIIRDEALGWVSAPIPSREIDYYGITFDHNVPAGEKNPEVLAINIIELEAESGEFADGIEFAKRYLHVKIDPDEYIGKRILAVPRCCQLKKGTQDQSRTNWMVDERDAQGKWSERQAS